MSVCDAWSQDGGELTEAERERAAQLTAQTAPVTERKHFYRTEVHQIQDALLAEEEDVNGAIALGAACALMQTTAARCGMLTKDAYDAKSVRWSDENPLRVRDVTYSLRELMVEGADGETEATSHMQINWRRVKRRYYEVYLFRSGVTANSKEAVRRVTVFLTVLLIVTGRFRVCRRGMSNAQIAKLKKGAHEYRGLRLGDTSFNSWAELYEAAREDTFRINADMLDDPLVPRVVDGNFDLKASMLQRDVYAMLGELTLARGYEPNASGVYSYRKYAISMVCRALGYHKATRLAQHADVNQETVNGVYDADNANEDFGAGEMGRPQVEMEPTDSLASQRVPSIAAFRTPSDVPTDARAYREELLESDEWLRAEANVAAAETAVELASDVPDVLVAARAALTAAKAARGVLRPKLLNRVLKRHRVYEWAAGLERQRAEWSRTQLVALLDTVEYDAMSEMDAIAFHLKRVDRVEAAEVQQAAELMAARNRQKRNAAAATVADSEEREARLRARRALRSEYLGEAVVVEEATEATEAMEVVAAELGEATGADERVSVLDLLDVLDAQDGDAAAAELTVVAAAAAAAMGFAMSAAVQVEAPAAPAEAMSPDERLLREYEALQADRMCKNAKKALSESTGIPPRSLMRRLAHARKMRNGESMDGEACMYACLHVHVACFLWEGLGIAAVRMLACMRLRCLHA